MLRRLLLFAGMLMMLSSVNLRAIPGNGNGPPSSTPPQGVPNGPPQGVPKGPPAGVPPGPPSSVHAPEFDARTAGAAVALLVGGVLVLLESRRRPVRRR